MAWTRTVAVGAMAVGLAMAGCAKERGVIQKSALPEGAAGAPVAAATAEAAAPTGVDFTGAIVETMDASTYTYVHLKAIDGSEAWVAGPKTAVTVGQVLSIKGGFEMKSFKSNALDRTFERLIMVQSLGGTDKADAKPSEGAAPAAAMGAAPGHGEGSPHGAMGGDGAMQAPGAPAVPSKVEPGVVAKAEGDKGRTIAEVYAQTAELNGKPVAVRGVVVKVSIGIMGRNWVHIQDGSGAADKGDHDLTLTTDATPKAGDRVLATGTLAADRDFGAGYRYKAIVEQASVEIEGGGDAPAPSAAPAPAPAAAPAPAPAP
jgi:hypothetical protein